MRRRATKVLKITIVVLVLVIAGTALRIYTYSDNSSDTQADAAVVLGAAVWSQGVSPVFRERINHAIELYRRGRVHKIIFTGGQGNRNEPTKRPRLVITRSAMASPPATFSSNKGRIRPIRTWSMRSNSRTRMG